MFAVVMILITSSQVFAQSGLDLEGIHTKKLVRMRLWYEGISQDEAQSEQEEKTSKIKPLPEELGVALNLLEV